MQALLRALTRAGHREVSRLRNRGRGNDGVGTHMAYLRDHFRNDRLAEGRRMCRIHYRRGARSIRPCVRDLQQREQKSVSFLQRTHSQGRHRVSSLSEGSCGRRLTLDTSRSGNRCQELFPLQKGNIDVLSSMRHRDNCCRALLYKVRPTDSRRLSRPNQPRTRSRSLRSEIYSASDTNQT
jgi:hypothetical protein